MPAGKYTLADFIARVRRVTNSQAVALYHENRPLFEGRPDVFARIVESVPWERGLALAHAARYRQNIDQQVFMALLRRMVRHNRGVQRGSVAPPCASWAAVLTCYAEAYATHGPSFPSTGATLALRALSASPRVSWLAACRMLQLLQRQEQLSRSAVLAAAECCSTDSTWKSAMKLLGLVHKDHPTLLPLAVERLAASRQDQLSLLAPSPSEETAAVPPALQRTALQTIAAVTCHVPWKVALSNAMCFSYLTHAAAVLGRAPADGGMPAVLQASFSRAFGNLPWKKGLDLLQHVDHQLSDAERVLMMRPGVVSPSPAEVHAGGPEGHGGTELVLVPADAVTARRRAEFAAVVVHMMPNITAARNCLAGLGFSPDAALASSPVSAALLDVALASQDTTSAIQTLSSIQAAIPRHAATQLVLLLHRKKLFSAVCDRVLPFLVSRRCVLSQAALQALLECCVLHNRSVKPSAPGADSAAAVNWVTAVSLVTQLVRPVSSDVSLRSELAAPDESPLVKDAAHAIRPEALSLVVKICVEAGHADAALRCLGAAREMTGVELNLSSELEALLYCFVYKRPREARKIVEHATKKYGDRCAAPLRTLLQYWTA